MNDRSQCHGDTLPLGMSEPSESEIEHAKRSMRHAFVSAPPATGTVFGVPVDMLSETDKALAFDWLWQMTEARR